MEMSAGEFDQGAGAEHRRFDRHPVALTAVVWLADPNDCEEPVNRVMLSPPRTAFVENLSMSGLLLISSGAFPVHSVVGVRLRLGAHTFGLEGLVRWRTVEQVAGKRCYGCGIQFVRTRDTPEALIQIARYLKGRSRSAVNPDASSSEPGTRPEARSAYPPAATAALSPKKYPWE